MLDNPLIFGILCSSVITGIYTLIISKNNDNDNDKDTIKNNSIILFTISLIIIAVGQLLIDSNTESVEVISDVTSNISSNMLRGTPDF